MVELPLPREPTSGTGVGGGGDTGSLPQAVKSVIKITVKIGPTIKHL
jgi:hypothetical protein